MEITNSINQIVQSGANVLFSDVIVPGVKCIKHRNGSGLVTLRGITNQCNARFLVNFSGNIAANASAGEISLAITLDGEQLANTIMKVTPTATGAFFNISTQTNIDVSKGCCVTIAVKNISTQSVAVNNPDLIVTRVA